jgi:hypothetical protein
MPFTEDLSVFFDPLMFGVTAVFNGTTSVNGLMDLAYAEPLGNLEQGSAPVFTCAASDVGPVAHGDSLVAAGRTYKVCGVEPDGTGIVLLRLELQ